MQTSIAQSISESKPMTPQERLRRQLAEEFADAVAEFAVKVDKGARAMMVDDLRTAGAKQVYLDAARAFLLGLSPQRITAVNQAHAHALALESNESETVMREARLDIARFGGGRIQ